MGNSTHINNLATTNLPEQYSPDNFPNINMAENGQKPCCADDGSTFAGTGIYTLIVGGKEGVQFSQEVMDGGQMELISMGTSGGHRKMIGILFGSLKGRHRAYAILS